MELTFVEQGAFVLLISLAFIFVALPCVSSTHLSKLVDIAYEFRKIREELERRSQNDI